MLSLYTRAKALWLTRDRGASAVEYGLMVAAIAAVIAALVFILGDNIRAAFFNTCDAIADGTTGSKACPAP